MRRAAIVRVYLSALGVWFFFIAVFTGPSARLRIRANAVSVQRYMRLKTSEHRSSLVKRPASRHDSSCAQRHQESDVLSTVVDTCTSMRARTPPRSPISARAIKCLLGDDASREIACDACEPKATSKSYERVNTLIDLVSSSSSTIHDSRHRSQ